MPSCGALDGAREIEAAGAHAGLRRGARGLLQHRRARIAHAVDAVAHAHDPAAREELALDPGLGVLGGADGVEHVEHGAGRAAVERALERADAATTEETGSEPVEVTTRAAKVEAFIP
jgi:hypothetical protein